MASPTAPVEGGVPTITDQGSVVATGSIAGRIWGSDVSYSFRHSPIAIGAAVVAFVLIFSAVFARWVAPYNPFDLATINLLDASLPPMWEADSNPNFWLGTDDQGRDIFSAILFGMQVSLAIGVASVALSVILGVGLGLLSGYVGGRLDAQYPEECWRHLQDGNFGS